MDYYRQNELPETVKRYKAYTDSFQDWLIKTAIQRDIEHAAQLAAHAKTKKRSNKKGYKISIEEQERLANAIADTKQPLTDTSGLLDLDDAIRSRKEIAQYHRINMTSDAGHTFFNNALEGVRSTFASLLRNIPAALKDHDLTDEVSNFIFVYFPKDTTDLSEEEMGATAAHTSKDAKLGKKVPPGPKRQPGDIPFTKEETELQNAFLVLCFLYGFNRIRGIVRETWLLFHDGYITVVTAALITDLALAHVQQNVAALVEDLGIIDSGEPCLLSDVVKGLYTKLSPSSGSAPQDAGSPQAPHAAIHHLFCVDAIDHIEAYMEVIRSKRDGSPPRTGSDLPFRPFMPFLLFFEVIRTKKIKLPIWDKFTEDMLRPTETSDDWLPFGFQILLDVQGIVREDYRSIYKNVTEHALDVARLMRVHVEYEDRMWASGNKPDYMSRGETKFTNVFLQELVETPSTSNAGGSMTTDVFAAVHPTLAGLAMSYYNMVYQSTSIGKVQWIITSLCHLYNAARQVGGLEIAWPDLEMIIQMHGSQRIFVGDPPTSPNDFHNRFLLAMCVSTQFMASDYRHRGGLSPTVRRAIREKHGLSSHLPLEAKLRSYYGPNREHNRWLKLHAIFNHLHKKLETSPNMPDSVEKHADDMERQKLQDSFTTLAATIASKKLRNRKASPRVRKPKFSTLDDTYAPLFRCMQSELHANELHSSFDYLSFYRRAFDLVQQIRDKVLFDTNAQMARRDNINKNPDPDNFNLVLGLFSALRIKPNDNKIETTGNELSTEVVPLDQLKRIAKLMERFIKKEGSLELHRANLRQKNEWTELKASYGAEEASYGKSRPAAEDTPVMDDRQTRLEPSKILSEESPGYRPPGSWPQDVDIDLGGGHVQVNTEASTSEASVLEEPKDNLADTDENETSVETSGAFDDFLDDHSSQLGDGWDVEGDPEFSDAELETVGSIVTTPLRPNEPTDLGSSFLGHFHKTRYQAYVNSETDEGSDWADDLNLALDRAAEATTSEISDEIAQDEPVVAISSSHAETTGSVVAEVGVPYLTETTSVADVFPDSTGEDLADNQSVGADVEVVSSSWQDHEPADQLAAAVEEPMEVDLPVIIEGEEQNIIHLDIAPPPTAITVEPPAVTTKRPTVREILIANAASKELQFCPVEPIGVSTAPKLTALWLYDELFHDIDQAKQGDTEVEEPAKIDENFHKSEHNASFANKFHRFTSTFTSSRKRTAPLRSTPTASHLGLLHRSTDSRQRPVGATTEHSGYVPYQGTTNLYPGYVEYQGTVSKPSGYVGYQGTVGKHAGYVEYQGTVDKQPGYVEYAGSRTALSEPKETEFERRVQLATNMVRTTMKTPITPTDLRLVWKQTSREEWESTSDLD